MKKGDNTVASLELMRGLASLDVFFWHLLNADSGFPHIPGLYRLIGWSRESVIVFFVLSGYVIALSQQRRHRTALPFLKARVKRIVPLYVVALATALVTGWIVHQYPTSWQMIGHLFFLQSYEGSFVMPLPTDGPLWSLGSEFEFYMTLVLILVLRLPALMLFWWVVAIAGLVVRYTGHSGTGAEGLFLEYLGLSPCWLLGYFFAGLASRGSLSLAQALTLFLMIPLVSYADFGTPFVAAAIDDVKCVFLACLIVPLVHTLAVRQSYPEAKPLRHGWLIVVGVYLLLSGWLLTHPLRVPFPLPTAAVVWIPAVFFCIASLVIPIKTKWANRAGMFRRIALVMGGGSYALYVIHTPLLCLAIAFLPDGPVRFAILILVTFTAVGLLEYVVQPRLAAGIDYYWGGRNPTRIRE